MMSTSPTPDSGLQKRVARRRARVIQAAAQLFAEKGYHRTTTRDIAAVADVAEGTIFNYFESKEGLLMTLVGELANLQGRQLELEQSLDQDFRLFLHEYFTRRVEQIGDNIDIFLAVLPEILNTPELRERYVKEFLQPAMQHLEEHLQARSARGTIRAADFRSTARILAGTVLGLQFLMLLGDEHTTELWHEPAKLADHLTALTLDGLRSTESDTAT